MARFDGMRQLCTQLNTSDDSLANVGLQRVQGYRLLAIWEDSESLRWPATLTIESHG
jgi:hypothetical protein